MTIRLSPAPRALRDFWANGPGVSLRSTPDFTLSSAPRTEEVSAMRGFMPSAAPRTLSSRRLKVAVGDGDAQFDFDYAFEDAEMLVVEIRHVDDGRQPESA
jgi:hypothetical protein